MGVSSSASEMSVSHKVGGGRPLHTSQNMDFLATQNANGAAKQVSCQIPTSDLCPRAAQR